MSSDRDTFIAALNALYGFDQAQQQAANIWLNDFAKNPAAWQVGLDMLTPASPTEPMFFCANMLLDKVRREWGKLSQDQRSHLTQSLGPKLQQLSSDGRVPRVVPQRLCLVLAAAAALSGADAVQQLLRQAFDLASSTGSQGMDALSTCLTLLTALAEEAEAVDRGRRQALMPVMMGAVQQLLALMTSIMQTYSSSSGGVSGGASGGASGSMPYEAAVKCLHTWLLLNPAGCSTGCLMSPAELRSASEVLLQKLVELLSSADAGAAGAASELLVDVLGPGKSGPEAHAETATLQAVLSSLLAQWQLVREPGARPEAAAAITAVAAAVAERDTHLVAAPTEASISLAAVMLEAAAYPGDPTVSHRALDYFLAINTVPVAQRHPQLQRPVFQRLLPTVLRMPAYPPGFTSWKEEVEQDADSFNDFREQVLPDVCDTLYGMLREEYLSTLAAQLSDGADSGRWQQAEAAIYGLRVVAMSAKARALGGKAEAEAEAAATTALLLGLFGKLCGSSSSGGGGGHANQQWLMGNPWMMAEAAVAIGEYASWFPKAVGAPLEGALRLLLHALHHAPAWKKAAVAFRNICVRCAGQLSSAAVLYSLMDVAMSAIAPAPSSPAGASPVGSPAQPQHQQRSPNGAGDGGAEAAIAAISPLDYEDRAAVVEGIARIVSGLPTADATEAGRRLLSPFLARAQSLVAASATGNGSSAVLSKLQVNLLAAELRLLSGCIRFMEFPASESADSGHPALQLLESCWALLSRCSELPALMREPEVVESLCEVLQRSLLAAKGAAKRLLQPLISAILSLFLSSRHAAALDTLATVTEMFGQLRDGPSSGNEQGGPGAASLQVQALDSIVSACLATVQPAAHSPAALAAHGELLRGLLTLLDRHLLFARELLVARQQALQDAADLAVRCLALRERDPVSAALTLFTHLVNILDKLAASNSAQQADAAAAAEVASHRAALERVMASCGGGLVRALLLAACDTCPKALLRPLSGCLYALLGSPLMGQAARSWLASALQSPELAAMCSGPGAVGGGSGGLLSTADCAKFGALAARQPMLLRNKFDVLVSDFAGIARGEALSDALLAYEL